MSDQAQTAGTDRTTQVATVRLRVPDVVAA
jgi:hypothetical protein